MKKRKNNKVIIIVLVILLVISVGYAAMNRVLSISGNSSITTNSWDIHFENLIINQGSVTADTPTINNEKDEVNFTVNLKNPGDYYQFTVDVANKGTIDADIESVSKIGELTAAQSKYLKYDISFASGEEIGTKRLIPAGEFVRVKVRVDFDKNINVEDLPQSSQNLDLGFDVNCVQSEGQGTPVDNKGVKIGITADGSLDEFGTIVTIGTEKFYTMGTDGDNVKLLSMYHLDVGNDTYTEKLDQYTTEYRVVPREHTTGMQFKPEQLSQDPNVEYGTTDFGATSPVYEESIVKGYVEDYEVILENLYGIDIAEARLVIQSEIEDPNTFNCRMFQKCSTDYPWFYSVSYWTGAGGWSYGAYKIFSRNYYDNAGYNEATGFRGGLAVRPVIVIPKEGIILQ